MNIAYRRLLPGGLRRWLRSLVVECATPSCRGFHLSHPILRRLPGIFLNQGWYCSAACLREALQQRVDEQRRTAVTDLRQPPRMPFRLVLLAGGRVTEQQLAEARRIQITGEQARDRSHEPRRDLADALVQLGYASEEEVAAARAKEAGYPYYRGEAHPLAPAHQIPLMLLRRYNAVPVHYNPAAGGRLLVGFVYRVDRSLLQAIGQVMACRTEACIISHSSWAQHMPSDIESTQERVSEDGASQSRLVDLIVEEAMASHADRIAVGLTGKALWVRLEGEFQTKNLVIDITEDLVENLAGSEPNGLDSAGKARLVSSHASLREASRPGAGRQSNLSSAYAK